MTRARELADLLNGGQTIATDDNTAVLKLKSTDADASAGPGMDLVRDSGSPADDDVIGYIRFRADNDAGDEHNFCFMQAKILDASDGSEDAGFELLANKDGTNRSRLEVLSGETVFNEDSVDVDFRVESDGSTHALFMQASDGKIGMGTDSPGSRLHVDNGSTHADVIVKGGDATTNFSGGSLLLANPGMATNYGGTYLYHHKAGGSGDTNAAFNISQRTATGTYYSNIWNVDYENSTHAFYVPNGGVSGAAVFQINSLGHILHKCNHAGIIGTFENIHSSSPDGIDVAFTATAPDNNSRYFYRGRDNAINRYYVYSDGDVQNHDNSYGGTSDSKLKQQVADAASQWDDIKALKIRKFKFNSDVTEHGDSDALWRLGVVAQEVEAAGMTGLIKNNPDYGPDQFDEEKQEWIAGENLGTTTKAVKYSILYMKAVKALQEAMARIETLETKVATLEGE